MAAQHRCVFLRTWPAIQDYVRDACSDKKAPAVSSATDHDRQVGIARIAKKHNNAILACIPESDICVYNKKDYSNLHQANSAPLGSVGISGFDGDDVELSRISDPADFSKFLASGIDDSALPTEIDY